MLLTYPVEEKNQKLPSGAEINLIGAFDPVEMDDKAGDSLNRKNPQKMETPEKTSKIPTLYQILPSGPEARCQTLRLNFE
jgi:hypothetical protein